ncbi:MAG: TFIIB-type zinc ribbon-containing protein [Candidatus Hodarchaeota archaeon]
MSCDETCSECGQRNTIIYDPNTGQNICTNCGLVVGQDYAQELQRAFTPEEAKARIHHEPEYFASLRTGTKLPYNARTDSTGKSISAKKRSQFNRLAKTNDRGFSYKQRKLITGLEEMKRICSQLNISRSTLEYAIKILKQAFDRNIGKGKPVEGLAAAALIIASRKTKQTAIIAREIMNVACASSKLIAACVRLIQTQLNLKYEQFDLRKLCFNTCERLDLTMQTSLAALEVIDSVKTSGLAIGKHPASLVAAAVYIAAVQTGERRTQHQVAEAALTTPVTIRNRFKEIVETLKLENVNPSRGIGASPVYKEKTPKP